MKANKFLVVLMSVALVSTLMISCKEKNKPDTPSGGDDPTEVVPDYTANVVLDWGDSIVLTKLFPEAELQMEYYELTSTNLEIVAFTESGKPKAVGFGEAKVLAKPSSIGAVVSLPIVEVNVKVESHFLMYVEDVFAITGRGTVVTGRLLNGRLRTGQPIIVGNLVDSLGTISTEVRAIEMFHKTIDEVEAGDNVGLLLGADVEKTDIGRGAALFCEGNPDIYRANTFQGLTRVYSAAEGGKNDGFEIGIRPQLYFQTADVTSEIIALQPGVEIIAPGDSLADVTWRLIEGYTATIYEGMNIPVRSSGYTLGYVIANGK